MPLGLSQLAGVLDWFQVLILPIAAFTIPLTKPFLRNDKNEETS